ncbi:MAG: hypothetical protein R2865_14735 [Deinococcales bacterium]
MPSLEDIISNVIDPENLPRKMMASVRDIPPCSMSHCAKPLAHATDKQQLIDVVLLGLGTPGLGLVPDSLGDWLQ